MKVCVLDRDDDLIRFLEEQKIRITTNYECDVLVINVDLYSLNEIKKYKYRYLIIVLETLDHLHEVCNFKTAYLTKRPLDLDYIYHLMMSIKAKIHNEVTIKVRSSNITIDCDEIIYVTSNKRVLDFYGKNGMIVSCYMKLNDLELMLPNDFVRIHQSFIVNKKYIQSCSKYEVYLNEISQIIPMSRAFYKKNKDQLVE